MERVDTNSVHVADNIEFASEFSTETQSPCTSPEIKCFRERETNGRQKFEKWKGGVGTETLSVKGRAGWG